MHSERNDVARHWKINHLQLQWWRKLKLFWWHYLSSFIHCCFFRWGFNSEFCFKKIFLCILKYSKRFGCYKKIKPSFNIKICDFLKNIIYYNLQLLQVKFFKMMIFAVILGLYGAVEAYLLNRTLKGFWCKNDLKCLILLNKLPLWSWFRRL